MFHASYFEYKTEIPSVKGVLLILIDVLKELFFKHFI